MTRRDLFKALLGAPLVAAVPVSAAVPITFGAGTLAMLHGKEAVVPADQAALFDEVHRFRREMQLLPLALQNAKLCAGS